jgi:hypothetical protein
MQGSNATRSRITRFVTAAAVVACLATSAAAQNYDVTAEEGEWVSPPSSGFTDMLPSLGNKDDGMYDISSLPFPIPYFGMQVNSIQVATNGYCYMNGAGQYIYGYSPVSLPQSGGNYDGIVKVAMTDGDGRGSGARMLYWTDGTAPNRRFIVTWENWTHFSISGSADFQVQFYETGRIQMAYTGTWTWNYTTGVGIDAISPDSRFAAPNNNGSYTFYGQPPNDWRFEPEITEFSGRVLIERITSDDSGYGGNTATAVPVNGARIEIRTGSTVSGTGFTDENGDFTAQGVALDSSKSGALHITSVTAGASVTPSNANDDPTEMAPPFSHEFASGVEFGEDNDFDPYTLDDNNDANGAMRAPLQIAMDIDALRSHIDDVTGTPIPRIDVFYAAGSSAPSRYTKESGSGEEIVPSSMRVAGAAAANPDAFDPAVVARLYAREVLVRLTGNTTDAFTSSLDVAQGDQQAAFADGLGLVMWSQISGETTVFDGLSATRSDSLDLETPSLTRAPAPDVSGWAAAGLYDIVDASNETHDDIDGTVGTNANRLLTVTDSLTEPAGPVPFLDGWDAAGHAGDELVKDFIHHGQLPDDPSEPNDSRDTAVHLGTTGLRHTGLTLNRFNEDWFEVNVPEAADLFFVEMVYNRFDIVAQVRLEAYDGAGTLLNFGVPEGDNGPIRVTLPNLDAGPLFVRIAHQAGDTVTQYELQAYAQMSVALTSAPAWTVNKRIQEPLNLRGGVPPYQVIAKDSSGENFSQIQFLPGQSGAPFDMVWTPKEVGNTVIQIVASDAGSPVHTRTLNLTFQVNAELAFSAPELTGVALSKPADVNLGRVGGTDPITLSDEFGDLPDGLTVDEDFHIRGTATEPGGGAFGFTATDVAGSESAVDSFLVVCVPIETKNQSVPLAGGQAAAGFYFDALNGSVANFKLKTAKKQAKRELNFLVIGPDGNVVQGGKVKIKAGKVSVKGLVLPTTGRYFMAFESEDGGPATQLQGTLKLALPKKGAGGFERLNLGELYQIQFGALEGATLKLQGKTTEGMELRVRFIIKPDGGVIPFADIDVVNNNGKVTIATQPLPQSGTYTLVIEPLKTDQADLSFKYKLKQPKGGVFRIDD